MRVKLLVAAAVVAGAVSYLAYAGVKKGWVYMMPVDQFAQDSQYRMQRVRLTGKVAEENLMVAPAKLTASFRLQGQSAAVPVVYRGAIPDMFRANHEVIVEGKLDAAGVFQADVLLTKCASKYEATEKDAPPADHPKVAQDRKKSEKQS